MEHVEQATAAPGEMRELEHLGVLRLEPGDIIVARVKSRLTAESASRLKAQLEPQFPGHKVLVCEDVDIAAVRPVE